jgi:hypothetical protein
MLEFLNEVVEVLGSLHESSFSLVLTLGSASACPPKNTIGCDYDSFRSSYKLIFVACHV